MRSRQLTHSLSLVLALIVLAACGGPSNSEPVDGQALYSQHCAVCHGTEGGGLNGPSFHDNSSLAAANATIDRVLAGAVGMPAYRERMPDVEIAAVLTHVRTSWGNAFGSVDAQQVAARRAIE